MSKKKIAIILLNWNSYEDTFNCLKSLEMLECENFHVFLVDNDSSDQSFTSLKSDYSHKEFSLSITFLQSGGNLGFAGGNNVGIRKAYEENYEYFWMLNNDTLVESDTLCTLVSEMEKDKALGIVGSKIFYHDTNIIWFAGGLVNLYTGQTKHIGNKERDSEYFNSCREVDYISGCSMLFRKQLIDDIGYMNHDYFLYYEETEYNIRATKNGWKIKYIPNSIVHHKVSMSSGGEDNPAPYVEYYYIRNAFLMIKQTGSFFNIVIATAYLIWKTAKKLVKYTCFKPDKLRRKYIRTAFKHALFGPYGMLERITL